MQRATRLAGAANLASILTTRPMVKFFADVGEVAGLFSSDDLMAVLDRESAKAQATLSCPEDSETEQAVAELRQQVAVRAQEDWAALLAAVRTQKQRAPRARRPPAKGPHSPGTCESMSLIFESDHLRAEPDEDGRALDPRRATSLHVQRELALILEAGTLDKFLCKLESEDARGARRLRELVAPHTCHDWLWKINPREESRLAEEDFLLDLSSRLGADQVGADAVCSCCGEVLDRAVSHASCCSPAESTRGHYAVVAAVADGMALADPSLRTEVHGLVPTGERPADILTTAAIPGRQAALDITIASQDALHAGLDACASAHQRKITRYSSLFPALRRAGVVFQPMVWSAEGRPHPAVVRTMEAVVRLVRTKKGLAAAAHLRARWRHEIAIAIQRRKAAMIRACLPAAVPRRLWLQGRGQASGSTQLPPLEPD